MNWKKISLIFLVLLSFIGTGFMLSNVQSRQADQLIDAHGMSNNTRYFHINKNTSIKAFLKEISQRNYKSEISIHFDNLKDKSQVLIWSNHKILAMPTQKGRYFTREDFRGKVSLAVIGQDYNKNVVELQNNRYLVVNNNYYSVIGELNTKNKNVSNKYYLTTGLDQPTAMRKLKNYTIVFDSSKSAVLKDIENRYHISSKVPGFVKRHQYLRLSIFWEFFLMAIFWLIALIANVLIAVMQSKQAKLTHLSGKLLRNWIANRAMRIILGQLLLVILSYISLNWMLFLTKPQHLFVLLSLNYILVTISYITTWIAIMLRDKKHD